MLCESGITIDVELWELDEVRKVNDNVQGKFYKELMGLPRCAVNIMAEIEVVRRSRRRKAMWRAEQYWQ
jgi:hypothetical protein